MKHDLQRTAVRWLSGMAASIIGAYKLKDVVDLIITTVKWAPLEPSRPYTNSTDPHEGAASATKVAA